MQEQISLTSVTLYSIRQHTSTASTLATLCSSVKYSPWGESYHCSLTADLAVAMNANLRIFLPKMCKITLFPAKFLHSDQVILFVLSSENLIMKQRSIVHRLRPLYQHKNVLFVPVQSQWRFSRDRDDMRPRPGSKKSMMSIFLCSSFFCACIMY